MVEGESGESYEVPLVPTWGMVLEYLIKSCTGHPTTPKGGSKEYRNGPWYKPIYGRAQGDRMGERDIGRTRRCNRLRPAGAPAALSA